MYVYSFKYHLFEALYSNLVTVYKVWFMNFVYYYYYSISVDYFVILHLMIVIAGFQQPQTARAHQSDGHNPVNYLKY